jgi:hypothetical protein
MSLAVHSHAGSMSCCASAQRTNGSRPYLVTSWDYHHPSALAGVRLAAGTWLVVLSTVLIASGGDALLGYLLRAAHRPGLV